MKSNRTKMVLTVVFVASIVVIIGTISYAYFSITPSDNENQELVTKAGTMQLRFVDNDNGVNAQLNFGESITKMFIIENTGSLDAKVKINFTNMINTYLPGSLIYKLEMATEENSANWVEVQALKNIPKSSSSSTKTLANNLEVPAGATYYYRLAVTLVNSLTVNQTSDLNAIFTTQFNLEEATESTVDKIIASVNPGNPDFGVAATTDEGIYSMPDDYGMSYYYRGASEYNYVKYGQDKDGNDMYWRIVRINGDGSLRIIYDGTQAYANGTANNVRYAIKKPWNVKENDAKYVGWMFGGAQGEASTSKEQAQTNETDSNAKTTVDNWYKENIVDTGYADDVADVIFCNDRTTPESAESNWSGDTGLGYAKNDTLYGAYARFASSSNQVPQFICEEKNDSFTVYESEKGNGALTYPVGLITADEVVVAGGGKYNTSNTSYYLYKSSSYYGWTFSPSRYTNSSDRATIFRLNLSGGYSIVDTAYTNCAFAPVINLSADYASELIGDGSRTNPYRAAGVSP